MIIFIMFNKMKRLNGRCDFIISKSKEQYSLSAPVLVMVEAKNDNIKSTIPVAPKWLPRNDLMLEKIMT
jgi:hypothetical protein